MPTYALRNILIVIVSISICSCNPGGSHEDFLTDSSSIVAGRDLFIQNCSGCHNFKQRGIGPDLSGITETDSLGWLKNFIRSPKALVDAGDEHAKDLLDDYHTMMPSFAGFSDKELERLIAYLHTHKGRPEEKEDPLAVKDPIPEKILSSGLTVSLEPFLQLPYSNEKEPHTRLSQIEWTGRKKTLFVLDQNGQMYKLFQGGLIRWFDMRRLKSRFISQPGLATGFGSFAFHPEYERNGIFYTTHCEPAHSQKADFAIPDTIHQTLQWVLCEWKNQHPEDSVFEGTSRELMRLDMVKGIHGVQEIAFNPLAVPGSEDYGLLYIGVGDGGSVEDGFPFLTHHPDHPWGTILRINPLGKNSLNGQYGIPSGNPFVNNPDSNTVREIYAVGFRNPNRFNWTTDGQMLVTNIGQAEIEAIDIVYKGRDYGWPDREGNFLLHPEGNINRIYQLPENDSIYHYVYPAAEFDHDEGKAIAGGFEYTGKAIAAFRGKYIFGDIPGGRLFYVSLKNLKPGGMAPVKEWFVSLHGKKMSLKELCRNDRVDLRFARDDQGELYISTKADGKIYRLAGQETVTSQ